MGIEDATTFPTYALLSTQHFGQESTGLLADAPALPAGVAVVFPEAQLAGLLTSGKGLIEALMLEAMAPGARPLVGFVTERTTVSIPARGALTVGGKMAVEEALVDAVLPRDPMATPTSASAQMWESIAAHYAEGAELDPASRRLITEKTITAEQAMAMAFSKRRVEDPLLAMVLNFQVAIALDTARNEHLLHRQIHQWFVDGQAPMDPDELTSRVYAELFLTPDEDPWLGLVPADTYSALDAGGLEAGE